MSASFASSTISWVDIHTALNPVNPPAADSEAWKKAWGAVYARGGRSFGF